MADKDAVITGLGPAAMRPLVTPYLDITRLKLSPVEGFILSRIDGVTSYREIIMMSGMPPRDVEAILRGLKGQGVLLNPGETPTPPPPAWLREAGVPIKTPIEGDPPRPRQPSPPIISALERLDDKSTVDPAELIGGKDLDAQMKTRLIRLHRRMGRLKATELLGVSETASARELKQAYFQASKEIHPDRYFGKDLGPFGDILEKVFRRFSDAFNELNDPLRKKKG
jgi:DnaJ domain